MWKQPKKGGTSLVRNERAFFFRRNLCLLVNATTLMHSKAISLSCPKLPSIFDHSLTSILSPSRYWRCCTQGLQTSDWPKRAVLARASLREASTLSRSPVQKKPANAREPDDPATSEQTMEQKLLNMRSPRLDRPRATSFSATLAPCHQIPPPSISQNHPHHRPRRGPA
jgi:hypothetical protein